MMKWVIFTRSPRGKLMLIVNRKNEAVEFDSEAQAVASASTLRICMSWGFQVVAVNQKMK